MTTETTMTRRRFLVVSGCALAAALCSGCLRDSTQDATPTESDAAQASTSASAPTATAAAAQTSTPAATAAATPAASSTRVTTRCPRNQVNDPYPGRCHHYTDSSGNGICDYSEA